MELSLQELINNSIREKRNGEKKEQKSWYASSLGGCLRGIYFQRLGVKPDTELTDRELRVFNVGNQMEDWLIKLISSQKKVKAETQVRVYSEEWNLSGKVDLVMEYNGIKKIYEIKTKHSRAFWWMLKEGKPMRQHEQQLWIYLELLGIEEGNLIYLSKDDLAIQEYIIRRNDKKLEEEVLDQINLLNKSWKEKDPALLPLLAKDSWQNKYCRFHSHCTTLK